MFSGGEEFAPGASSPRAGGKGNAGTALPGADQLPKRSRRTWPLTAGESALLVATGAVFVVGSLLNLATAITSLVEPRQLVEFLLALPLVTLIGVLILNRRRNDRQQEDARYRTLVEQIPAVIYLLAADDQATRLYFSPYSSTLTGYTPEEAMAQADHWLEWVHPADRQRVVELDAETIAQGVPFRAEYRHLRKDGGYVWVLDECVPVRADNGTIIAWQGVVLDISDRVESVETQARLASIVDSADDAIISFDLSGAITSWNRGAEDLYGYRAEEMHGQPIAILFPQGLIDPELAARIASVQAGHPGQPYTTVRRRQDGSLVDVTISLFPIRDHTGNVTGLSSITRDITAAKRVETQLQSALRAAQAASETKSQFLAMMSHELRTPLQAVLGYTEFLLANPASAMTPDEREDLRYIQQGGLRMLALINQLLDLSRLEAGRLEVVLKPVDLSEVLENVRQDVAPQAMIKDLDLDIDLPSTLPPVLGDPERLRQVLLNLVGNAVKFTASGAVVVRADMKSNVVFITVADTGIGIPPQELPQIFEAFRQVDSRLSRRHGGAGLGLAIAQRLAGLMGGQITVDSQLGVGSTFTLTLPALAASSPQQELASARFPHALSQVREASCKGTGEG